MYYRANPLRSAEEGNVMKIEEPEITKLKNQIEDSSIEISLLELKYKTAAEIALKFAQQLEELRINHQGILLKLRDLEQHEHGSYMWENIGDGG